MTSTKYIGMDVHKESISIAVMNAAGKIVMECVIETKASILLQFIHGLRGDLQVTFEEGTWAAWLYDLLKPHVTEVVVCNPRKIALLKDGSKSDRIDARKLLRQIPGIGPIRAALLVALIQTPHRFRTKRQLWTYSGLGLETHDSAQYRVVEGQLQRSKKPATLRGLNENHNHDLKDIFKGAAMRASTAAGPLHDFYEALLTKGRKPTMARSGDLPQTCENER
jgi:transposase